LISLENVPLASGMRLVAGQVGAIAPNRPQEQAKDAGWITSSARSGDRQIGLAYVKRGFNSTGTTLDVALPGQASVPVQVVKLPFSN